VTPRPADHRRRTPWYTLGDDERRPSHPGASSADRGSVDGAAALTSPSPERRVPLSGPSRVTDTRDLAGEFGFRTRLDVRFADTDAMGHVNNAAYLTYVEAARIAWWMAATGEPLEREPGRAEGLILAEAELAFRSPLFFGETVTIETRASRIGRTSLGLEHRLTAARGDGPVRLAAICRSVLVRYDYDAETPVAWRAELIAAIEVAEGRPLRG
jgi:acyl-CoA thioester hydrolase